jgi:hypothetical protein
MSWTDPELERLLANCANRSGWTNSCGSRLILFCVAACHDLQRIIRQRSLQRLRLIPSSHGARIHTSRSSSVVRITGIALEWIGSMIAFGVVARKPYARSRKAHRPKPA